MAQRGRIITLENPTSSFVWLDPACISCCRFWVCHAANVAACQCGLDMDKRWLFVSNHPCVTSFASVCPYLRGFHVALAGLRLPDGSFNARLSACYPPSLAAAIASTCSQLLTGSQPAANFWPRLHSSGWCAPCSRPIICLFICSCAFVL